MAHKSIHKPPDTDILIVEDSLVQGEQLKRMLLQHGYAVTVAKDATDALAAIRRQKPHLVISDIVMPGKDGFDLCREIKGDDELKDIPVVLVTFLTDPEDIIRGLECKADHFLTKPYEESNLITRIEHLLINKELRKNQRVQIGIEMRFGGKDYLIDADRRQILDLLFSTYENGVVKNRELINIQQKITQINEDLEKRVKERTEDLRASESKYRSILEWYTDAILVVDRHGTIQYMNPAARNFFCVREKELLGEPFGFPADPDKPSELEIVQSKGLKVIGEMRSIQIEWGGEASYLISIRDITARKKVEARLSRKTEQLEAVSQAMVTFLKDGNWQEASGMLLRCAIKQTESEYGFIGVVAEGPVLRILAHEGIIWDSGINREFYENAVRTYREVGYLEFTNFENLFGRAITSGQAVLSNDPASDPRSGHCLPPGHPVLRSFLGVPILSGSDVVGLIGVANCPGGYTGHDQTKIEVLSNASSVLYATYLLRERESALEKKRREAEAEVSRQAQELVRKNSELEGFNRHAVGREMRMIELKRQVNELSGALGRPAPYDLSQIEGKGQG